MFCCHFVQVSQHDFSPQGFALVERYLFWKLVQHAAKSCCKTWLFSNVDQTIEVSGRYISVAQSSDVLNQVHVRCRCLTHVFVNMHIAPDFGSRRRTCLSTRS